MDLWMWLLARALVFPQNHGPLCVFLWTLLLYILLINGSVVEGNQSKMTLMF